MKRRESAARSLESLFHKKSPSHAVVLYILKGLADSDAKALRANALDALKIALDGHTELAALRPKRQAFE